MPGKFMVYNEFVGVDDPRSSESHCTGPTDWIYAVRTGDCLEDEEDDGTPVRFKTECWADNQVMRQAHFHAADTTAHS